VNTDSLRQVAGPSTAALNAIRELSDISAAPDAYAGPLRSAIAEHYGISEQAVRVGAGSAALLHGVIARQAPTGGEVVCSAPTWPPYAQLASSYGMRPRPFALDGYDHDLPAIAAAAGPATRLAMLDSPHSVTGTTVSLTEVAELADALPGNAVVVYDNVYGEYQDDDLTTAIRDTVRSGARVLIFRSFSKAHRLFGLRIGYLLGHPDILEAAGPIVLHYDVNQPAQVAARASLADHRHLAENCALVRRNRHLAIAVLADAGIAHAPSQGNSVLFRWNTGSSPRWDLEGAAALLRTAGAFVRTPDEHGIAGHLHLRVDDLPAATLKQALTRLVEGP
jgi:histidinol-phosphate aminotransferase